MRLAGGLPGTTKRFLSNYKYRHFLCFFLFEKKLVIFGLRHLHRGPGRLLGAERNSRRYYGFFVKFLQGNCIYCFFKKDLTKLVVIGGFNLEDDDLDLVQVYDLSGETPGDGLCNTLQV